MDSSKATLSWDDLIKELDKLAEANKLTYDDVSSLLKRYSSKEEDWLKYCKFSKQSYTRVLAHEYPEKYNMLIISWDVNQYSCIHDHAKSDCHVKVLRGPIKETIYENPLNNSCCAKSPEYKLKIKSESIYQTNDVSFINGKIGLHRMGNSNNTTYSVSMHIYIPPFEICKTFDEITSQFKECKLCYEKPECPHKK